MVKPPGAAKCRVIRSLPVPDSKTYGLLFTTRYYNNSNLVSTSTYIMSDSKVTSVPAPSAKKLVVPVAHSSEACEFLIAKPSRPHCTAYLWDTWDKSPEERRFLFKLDAAILTIASLGYFIKNLDQININNAFVSGMKEDLDLNGNELNYMQTCWTVGYIVGQIPRQVWNEAVIKGRKKKKKK